MVAPNPYDVDLRDEQGRTALMKAASEVNPSAIKLLQSFGADPNVLTRPGGFDALDLLLFRAEKDVGAGAPEGVELHLMRALDALIAGHPSLHPAHRQLLAHPETWKLDPRARAFWTAVASKVSSLPARNPFSPICSTPELHLATLGLGADVQVAQASQPPAQKISVDHAASGIEDAAVIRVYEEMKAKLKRGDIEGALSHFTEVGKANQRTIFEQLGSALPNAVDNLGRIVEVQTGPRTAEITLDRDTPQGKRAVRVMMVRSYDGKEWKIDSM
jgi:hypothetical protein